MKRTGAANVCKPISVSSDLSVVIHPAALLHPWFEPFSASPRESLSFRETFSRSPPGHPETKKRTGAANVQAHTCLF